MLVYKHTKQNIMLNMAGAPIPDVLFLPKIYFYYQFVTLFAVQSSLTFLAPFKVMMLSFNLFISKRFFSKIVYFLCSPSVLLDRVDVTYQRNQILH